VATAPGEEASAVALHLLHLQSIGCLLRLQAPQPAYKTDFQRPSTAQCTVELSAGQENEFGPNDLARLGPSSSWRLGHR